MEKLSVGLSSTVACELDHVEMGTGSGNYSISDCSPNSFPIQNVTRSLSSMQIRYDSQCGLNDSSELDDSAVDDDHDLNQSNSRAEKTKWTPSEVL